MASIPGLLLGLLLGLLVLPGRAQAPAEPAIPAAGPVDLEIIAFRRGGGGGTPAPLMVGDGPVPGIPPGDLALDGTRRRLGASGFVTPLAHLGWRTTPGNGPSASGTIPLPGSSGLTGWVQVYRQGSLYLALDLSWPADAMDTGSGPRETARIRETRRVRNTGLLYFDHPDFGIIAQVRGVAPAAAPAAPAAVPGSGPGAAGSGAAGR